MVTREARLRTVKWCQYMNLLFYLLKHFLVGDNFLGYLIICFFKPVCYLDEILSRMLNYEFTLVLSSSGGSDSKESACSVGELGSVPGSGRSPREGKGNPLQYSFLENSMDRGVLWATVHRVIKSRIWLSDFHFQFSTNFFHLSSAPLGIIILSIRFMRNSVLLVLAKAF